MTPNTETPVADVVERATEAKGPWLWFAGEEPDVTRDGVGFYNLAEERTREEAIAEARRWRPSGLIHVIEARCFQHRERGEAEDDPIRFAETRNHEIVGG